MIEVDQYLSAFEEGLNKSDPQKNIELLVACLPSYDFLLRFEGHLNVKPDTKRKGALETALKVKNVVKLLNSQGASLLEKPSDRTIIQAFGTETPLFLIGAMMGMSDLLPSTDLISNSQIKLLIDCFCEYEDVDSLSKIWPTINHENQILLSELAWKRIPTSLLNDSKFIVDPLDSWWKWALDRNPPGSPGRAQIEQTALQRKHLSSHLVLAQVSSEPKEMMIGIQKGSVDESQFLPAAMFGWAKTLDGKDPTERQLKNFFRRMTGLEAAGLFPKDNTSINGAFSCLASGILMSAHDADHCAYKYSPIEFPKHQLSFDAILTEKESHQLPGWDDLLFLDLARISADGYALYFKQDFSNSSYLSYSILTNHMLNGISRHYQDLRSTASIGAINFWKYAARICKSKSVEPPPEQNLITAENADVIFQSYIWNLALLRMQRINSSGSNATAQLNSRERALIKSIQRLNEIGAKPDLSPTSCALILKALSNDPYAPEWIVSFLEHIVLTQSSQGQSSSGNPARRL